MKELQILIGNIGSGKSTYCKEKVKEGYIIISRDTIRYGIGSGKYIYNPDYEPSIKASIKELALSLMEGPKPNIIIDETNMTEKIRINYINISKIYGYKRIALIFPVISKEESVKRRMSCNHGDTTKEKWEEVWTGLHGIYQKPTIAEGFDEVIEL